MSSELDTLKELLSDEELLDAFGIRATAAEKGRELGRKAAEVEAAKTELKGRRRDKGSSRKGRNAGNEQKKCVKSHFFCVFFSLL